MTSTPTSTSATVLRFSRTERAVHWCHGIAFVVALFSGLALFIGPLEELIGHRFILRWIHIGAGLAFALIPVAIARLGNWRSIKSDFGQAQWWDDDDRRFFSTWLSGEDAPVGRFNAGQKANMMFTAAATLFFLASGTVMWQYLHFDAGLVQNAGLLHDSLTVAILVVWLGHLWYALGNPKTRHSMRGMLSGYVRRDWAAELHPKWLRAVEEEAEAASPAVPAPAGTALPAPRSSRQPSP